MSETALSVLVVDDDGFVLNAVVQVLQLEGHTVTTAGDSLEALAAVASDAPDVLLTDLRLLGTDGCELVRLAREVVPALPAVIMTSFPNVRAEIRACEAVYLAKPFGLTELLDSIRRAAASRPAGPA